MLISFNHKFSEKDAERALIKTSKKGILIKKIFSFPDLTLQIKTKADIGDVAGVTFYAYPPSCYFRLQGKDRFCYGESIKYRIFIFDGNGDII